MLVAKRLLLTAFLVLSCLQEATCQHCLCTSRDNIQLYDDADLTSELITLTDRNTCFLSTQRTDTNEKYVALGSLALGKCGDAVLDSDDWSLGLQALGDHTADTAVQYYGKFEDFYEQSSGGTRKRFLENVGAGAVYWTLWSTWSDCIATSCNDFGQIIRTRECKNKLDAVNTCSGSSREILSCHISCADNKTIGWSGWMAWSDCGSSNCLNMTTTRKRQCLNDGLACIGPITDTKTCTQDLCAVDGGWTSWSPWSTCSKASGESFMNRLRSCTNPTPSHGGNGCDGQFWDIRGCRRVSEWSDWESWGSCKITNNHNYIQFRNRSCTHEDTVDTTASTCHETERLDYRACQFYGEWELWGSWSACSQSQKQGTKTRNRTCRTDTAVDHTCIGKAMEEISCTDNTTQLTSVWSSWTECVSPCNGTSTRRKHCDNPGSSNCTVIEEFRTCTLDVCNVDGNWATWTEWSECTDLDGLDFRVRNRTCTDPEPRNAGSLCFGKSSEVQYCNSEPEWGNWQDWLGCQVVSGIHGVRFRLRTCHAGRNNLTCSGQDFESDKCLVQAEWLDWTEWSGCSVTCGSGMLSRSRSCNKTAEMDPCNGTATEDKSCQPSPHCPVDGGYSVWGDWSPCPVSCGPGALSRTRYCNNPSPSFGGNTCASIGDNIEASFCDVPCPVDGHWSDWGSWGNCSATCDYGTMSRIRTCSNPSPSNGGHDCEGTNSSTQNCTLPLCNVDGGWSEWSNFSQCSCEKQHTRHRDCNNPTPVSGGKYCVGSASDVASCEPNPHLACPIDGAWAEWLEWSSTCSVTCGQGTVQRYRQCSNPRPQFGGQYCKGALSGQKPCIKPECPRDGVWASWSAWSTCSVTCGNGTQFRDRQCDPPPMYGGANCSGDSQENEECVQNPCPINGEWSDWQSWGGWDATCSFATRSRTRKCDRPAPQHHGLFCVGEITDTESGDLGHCPIDGIWSVWQSWTPCSVTCENGTHSRARVCDNPAPQYNGLDCVGNQTDTEICSDRPSCVIDGNWGSWLEWFGCDVTCGSGTNTRYRACTSPKPENGGKTCIGDFEEKNICNMVECPVDGAWSQWGQWKACSVTCANGTQLRSRSCSHPLPKYGGQNCQGNITDIQSCQLGPCPIDGSWSTWQTWSSCAETCGNTTKTRTRMCDNPSPQYNGSDCQGHKQENTDCILTHCPVDGMYGEWQTWEACSVTCNVGTRLRHRLCDTPPPQYGGTNCIGNNETSESCNQQNCPVDGGWSTWTKWSTCRGTCDNAIHQRVRNCGNPAPSDGGAFCVGEQIQTQSCTPATCTLLTSTPTVHLTTQPPTTPSTTQQPATVAATTPTSTNASANFQCYTCDGPFPEFCLTMMKPITCPHPYCINELTNSVSGEKLIDRRCGTKDECDKDWWTTTSDNDKCTLYDDTQTVTNYIHCTFCCKDELCNKPTVPTAASMYKPNI